MKQNQKYFAKQWRALLVTACGDQFQYDPMLVTLSQYAIPFTLARNGLKSKLDFCLQLFKPMIPSQEVKCIFYTTLFQSAVLQGVMVREDSFDSQLMNKVLSFGPLQRLSDDI